MSLPTLIGKRRTLSALVIFKGLESRKCGTAADDLVAQRCLVVIVVDLVVVIVVFACVMVSYEHHTRLTGSVLTPHDECLFRLQGISEESSINGSSEGWKEIRVSKRSLYSWLADMQVLRGKKACLMLVYPFIACITPQSLALRISIPINDAEGGGHEMSHVGR